MQTRGGSLSSTLSSIMNRIKKEGNGAGATASKIKTVNRITMEDDEYNVMGIDLGTTKLMCCCLEERSNRDCSE